MVPVPLMVALPSQEVVPVTVTVGEPLVLGPDEGVAAGTRRLRATMTAMLHAAQEAYPDRPSGPDDAWWLPARLGGTACTAEEGVALVNARRKAAAGTGGTGGAERDSGARSPTT